MQRDVLVLAIVASSLADSDLEGGCGGALDCARCFLPRFELGGFLKRTNEWRRRSVTEVERDVGLAIVASSLADSDLEGGCGGALVCGLD